MLHNWNLFPFNIFNFPNEFNLSLIEKYGWYRAKNRGDNLNGISRDHIFSVKEGFLNQIPSEIISHPANCRLIPHPENNKKNTNCDITIDELYRRVEEWEIKYNKKEKKQPKWPDGL